MVRAAIREETADTPVRGPVLRTLKWTKLWIQPCSTLMSNYSGTIDTVCT